MMVAKETSSRRSDEIRRRRKTESRAMRSKTRHRRHHRSTSLHTTPPVMARNPFSNVGMAKQKRIRTARRRYDLALNAQGVEMRLPSLPRVRPGWRLVSFSLIALMAVLLYQFWEYPAYRVEAAEVSGLQRISRSDVNSVLQVSGEQIFTIDELAIQQELQEAFPEFSAVAVSVDLPQTLVITVTERVPALIWQQDDHAQLIDQEGLSFPLRDGSDKFGLPVVEAEDPPPVVPAAELTMPFPALQVDSDAEEMSTDEQLAEAAERFPVLSPDMVEAILTLAEHAPSGAKIQYNNEHGFYWRDPGDWVVYFGNEQDVPMKLLVYEAIYAYLDKQDTLPSVISVEYVHAPYYRLEP